MVMGDGIALLGGVGMLHLYVRGGGGANAVLHSGFSLKLHSEMRKMYVVILRTLHFLG